jgi:hypothetical protein
MNQTTAGRRLADLMMEDMPTREITARLQPVPADWYTQYVQKRPAFLQSLSDSIQDLSFMNINQDDFLNIMRGDKLPENVTIHLRVPLQYGGKIENDNMFLCPTYPFAVNIDIFMIEQFGNPTLFIPDPKKRVYIPTRLTGGGEGGNATTDRLSQLSAQLAGGRDF